MPRIIEIFLRHGRIPPCPVKPGALPRGSRRGFGMAEMALALIVTAMIMQTGIELATAQAKRRITQSAAANMSRVADDVHTFTERNYFAISAELAAAQGNVVERDWDDLIGENLVSLDVAPTSPDGGNLRLFHTLRGDTVYTVVMSFGGVESGRAPRPGPNTRFAGKIQAHDPNNLSGWDFSLEIPEIAALTGEDLTGNIGVIRRVSFDTDVDPYLHRIEIPGRPELNRMLADLDMGGFAIDNALTVEARNFNVEDEMTVAGRLTADEIASTGDAMVGEILTDRVVSDEMSVDNATVSNVLDAVTAVVRGDLAARSITGGDASFSDLSTTTFSGGSVFLGSGDYIQLNAGSIEAESVIADRVFIGD